MGRPLVFRSLKVAKHSGRGREPRAVTDGTTLLFGLPGVWVGRVERWADGTRVVHAVTASEAAAACPSCGGVSTSVKARVTTSPRDIPYGQERIILRWNKTRWRCREDYCERGSFTESIAQVPARARTTGRLRTQIGAAIGEAARSVAEVAAAHGVAWPTAHRAVITHPGVEVTGPPPPQVIGIDETRRGKPRWERCAQTRRWVRVDPWDTGFVDLAGSQGLLGQREGPAGAAVIEWLRERTPEFQDSRHGGCVRIVASRLSCGFPGWSRFGPRHDAKKLTKALCTEFAGTRCNPGGRATAAASNGPDGRAPINALCLES